MQFEWNGHTALRDQDGFVCPELLAATHRDVPAKLKEPITTQEEPLLAMCYADRESRAKERSRPEQERSEVKTGKPYKTRKRVTSFKYTIMQSDHPHSKTLEHRELRYIGPM